MALEDIAKKVQEIQASLEERKRFLQEVQARKVRRLELTYIKSVLLTPLNYLIYFFALGIIRGRGFLPSSISPAVAVVAGVTFLIDLIIFGYEKSLPRVGILFESKGRNFFSSVIGYLSIIVICTYIQS